MSVKKKKFGFSRLTLNRDVTKLLAEVLHRFAAPDMLLITVYMTH